MCKEMKFGGNQRTSSGCESENKCEITTSIVSMKLSGTLEVTAPNELAQWKQQ